jgi:hypothetical protein
VPTQSQSQPTPQTQRPVLIASSAGSLAPSPPPRRPQSVSDNTSGSPPPQQQQHRDSPRRSPPPPRLDTSSGTLRNRRNSHFGLLGDGLGRIESAIVSSPLAQLFQPIVVEHDPVDMGVGGLAPIHGVMSASSSSVNVHTPGVRRRLTSMTSARHRRLSSVDVQQQQFGAGVTLPGQQQQHHYQHVHPLVQQHLAHSPLQHTPPAAPAATVLERERDEAPLGVDWRDWTRRMEDMEQRQERIENLLVALAGELRTAGNRPNLGRSTAYPWQ